MTMYEDSLKAMYALLNKTGERFWRDWIREDIHLWESSKSVEHHLSAYGGMGSLNDVVICQMNKHNVTKEQESWVNPLFSDLKSICYYFAKRTGEPNPTDGIESAMGSIGFPLQGWRCLKCGYAEVSSLNLEDYIAPHLVRHNILQAMKQSNLEKFVDEVINLQIEEAEAERSRVRKAVGRSGIEIVERDDWMRPCPACGSNDTAVYRWEESGLLLKCFEPTIRNLPLRS